MKPQFQLLARRNYHDKNSLLGDYRVDDGFDSRL